MPEDLGLLDDRRRYITPAGRENALKSQREDDRNDKKQNTKRAKSLKTFKPISPDDVDIRADMSDGDPKKTRAQQLDSCLTSVTSNLVHGYKRWTMAAEVEDFGYSKLQLARDCSAL